MQTLSPRVPDIIFYPSGRFGSSLLTVALLTTIGAAIPVGYNIGVINSPANFIQDWCNETIYSTYGTRLTSSGMNILWSAIVSIFVIGGAIGSLGGSWLSDILGRKGCFLLSGALLVIGAVLFQFCRLAESVEMLMIGRIIVGLGSGLVTASLPIYHTELAPLALRGTVGVFCSIGVTAGVVVGQILSLKYTFGTEDSWHHALSAYAILIVICYLPCKWFPESPKYLYLIKGNHSLAESVLMKLRGTDPETVELELKEMENDRKEKSMSRSLRSVLTDYSLLLPIVIVCTFQGGQQLSGINAVFYYSVTIFQEAGLQKDDAEWANLGAGSLNLLTAFFTPLIMAKINRRPVMLTSTFASAIALFALTFIIHYINAASWLPMACIVCVLLYILFYQIGIGPIPYFIGSEIVNTESRPAVMALGSLASWSCNFAVAMLFPTLQAAWGAFVFLPFFIDCVVLFLITKFYLPETRGRDSSEIAPLISKGFHSKPTS
ncbi:solute carrier family 2, facilitated glucose transporter member 3-like isoform X1 [Hermetia illucens]|uniref:solute carrier family 2, facilitated glucose transporter member 3-like isoform X1 n=2 Tax=Hermetia illucens TaxID=343691 RepID=UPI0018CC29E9|nr:solute carrier family 2, facilitated glucose transporter member 3-like isoform X1 [Hermetia illucens]